MANSALAGITNGGLTILSEDIKTKLAKKNISPSLVTAMQGCPARWIAESFVLPEILPPEPDTPATRGQLFHKVMEEAFRDEPTLRTRERLNEHRDAVLESEEFKHFKEIPDALEWLDNAIDGYYRMGGRPRKVKVAHIKREDDKFPKIGLEIFVKGHIGNAKRSSLGFVDRLTEDQTDPDNPGVVIEDWKSGAKAKKWNPKTKSEDGRAEARQQTMYAMLLEQAGVNVTKARLLYPVAETVVDVDLKDDKFRESVIKDVEAADAALDNYLETNLFEYKPEFLCAWCPLAKMCPKAKIEKFQKARDAFAKQPPIEDLAEGFTFI